MYEISWRVSSASADASGHYAEAGLVNDGSGRVAMRHSLDPTGSMIIFTRDEWKTFTERIRNGELDFHIE